MNPYTTGWDTIELDALRAEHRERELRWHEDLAAEAALAAATRAREPAKRTRASASAAEPALDLRDTSLAPRANAPARAAAKRSRNAVLEPGQHEPQPVKWWLKSARKR